MIAVRVWPPYLHGPGRRSRGRESAMSAAHIIYMYMASRPLFGLGLAAARSLAPPHHHPIYSRTPWVVYVRPHERPM